MSDPAPDDPVVVFEDGVTVEKSFEPADLSVPVIAYTVRSEREEPVSVRLVDDVPDDVDPEDVGFHPDHGAEYWDIEGEDIALERSLDPGEEFVTVYGVRGQDAAGVERFLTRPTVESVTPAGDADVGETVGTATEPDQEGSGLDIPEVEVDSEAGEESSVGLDLDLDLSSPSTAPATDDPTGGDSTDDAGLTIGEAPTDDDPAADVDPATGGDPAADADPPSSGDAADDPDPTVGDDATADDASTAGDSPTDDPTADDADSASGDDAALAEDPTADDSLAAALAAEIRDGTIPAEDLETLRAALGASGGGSTAARVEHLQSRVTDLEAYIDALEGFLDEEGGAAAVVDGLRTELATTNERLGALESEVAALRAAADDDEADAELLARLDGLEDDLETLESGLADVAGLGDRLADTLGGLESHDGPAHER